jgi:hypothetical protein
MTAQNEARTAKKTPNGTWNLGHKRGRMERNIPCLGRLHGYSPPLFPNYGATAAPLCRPTGKLQEDKQEKVVSQLPLSRGRRQEREAKRGS